VFFSFVCDDFGVSLWVIMWENIFLIIQSFTVLLFFIQLVLSIKVSRLPYCPINMKYFYWYPAVGISIGIFIYSGRFHFLPRNLATILNTISICFHFLFLSLIIYKELIIKWFLKYLFFLFCLVLILLIIADLKNSTGESFAFSNGCLFIFCIYYFYELFKSDPIVDLNNRPTFFICAGIFVGAGLIVPFSLMHRYLVLLNIPRDTIYFYGMLSNFGYFIMNMFFIKALLCINKNK
jgi:hypothetical protein